MATQKPTNLQPVCQVQGCEHGAQIASIQGTRATWMRTCRRHTYLDIVPEQVRTPKSDK